MYRRTPDDGRDRQLSQGGDPFLGPHLTPQAPTENIPVSKIPPISAPNVHTKTSVLRQYRKSDCSADSSLKTVQNPIHYPALKPEEFCAEYPKMAPHAVAPYQETNVTDQQPEYQMFGANPRGYFQDVNKISYYENYPRVSPVLNTPQKVNYWGGQTTPQVETYMDPKLVYNQVKQPYTYCSQVKKSPIENGYYVPKHCDTTPNYTIDRRISPQAYPTKPEYPNVYLEKPCERLQPDQTYQKPLDNRYYQNTFQKPVEKYRQTIPKKPPYPILENRLNQPQYNEMGEYVYPKYGQIVPPRVSPSRNPNQNFQGYDQKKFNWVMPRDYRDNAYLTQVGQMDPSIAQGIINTPIKGYEIPKDPLMLDGMRYPFQNKKIYYPESVKTTRPCYTQENRLMESYAMKNLEEYSRKLPDYQKACQSYNNVYREEYQYRNAYPMIRQGVKPAENPPRNISPRSTFQENMPTIVIPPQSIQNFPENYYNYYQKAQYPEYQNRMLQNRYQQPRYEDFNQIQPKMDEYTFNRQFYEQTRETQEKTKNSEIGKLNLKEFLENWEDDEEIVSNLPDLVLCNNLPERNASLESAYEISDNSNDKTYEGDPKTANQTLYIWDQQNISPEMVSKYQHLAQYEKLPDNIKGYYKQSEEPKPDQALNLSVHKPEVSKEENNNKTLDSYKSVIVSNVNFDSERVSEETEREPFGLSTNAILPDLSLALESTNENLDMLSEYVNSNTSMDFPKIEDEIKSVENSEGTLAECIKEVEISDSSTKEKDQSKEPEFKLTFPEALMENPSNFPFVSHESPKPVENQEDTSLSLSPSHSMEQKTDSDSEESIESSEESVDLSNQENDNTIDEIGSEKRKESVESEENSKSSDEEKEEYLSVARAFEEVELGPEDVEKEIEDEKQEEISVVEEIGDVVEKAIEDGVVEKIEEEEITQVIEEIQDGMEAAKEMAEEIQDEVVENIPNEVVQVIEDKLPIKEVIEAIEEVVDSTEVEIKDETQSQSPTDKEENISDDETIYISEDESIFTSPESQEEAKEKVHSSMDYFSCSSQSSTEEMLVEASYAVYSDDENTEKPYKPEDIEEKMKNDDEKSLERIEEDIKLEETVGETTEKIENTTVSCEEVIDLKEHEDIVVEKLENVIEDDEKRVEGIGEDIKLEESVGETTENMENTIVSCENVIDLEEHEDIVVEKVENVIEDDEKRVEGIEEDIKLEKGVGETTENMENIIVSCENVIDLKEHEDVVAEKLENGIEDDEKRVEGIEEDIKLEESVGETTEKMKNTIVSCENVIYLEEHEDFIAEKLKNVIEDDEKRVEEIGEDIQLEETVGETTEKMKNTIVSCENVIELEEHEDVVAEKLGNVIEDDENSVEIDEDIKLEEIVEKNSEKMGNTIVFCGDVIDLEEHEPKEEVKEETCKEKDVEETQTDLQIIEKPKQTLVTQQMDTNPKNHLKPNRKKYKEKKKIQTLKKKLLMKLKFKERLQEYKERRAKFMAKKYKEEVIRIDDEDIQNVINPENPSEQVKKELKKEPDTEKIPDEMEAFLKDDEVKTEPGVKVEEPICLTDNLDLKLPQRKNSVEIKEEERCITDGITVIIPRRKSQQEKYKIDEIDDKTNCVEGSSSPQDLSLSITMGTKPISEKTIPNYSITNELPNSKYASETSRVNEDNSKSLTDELPLPKTVRITETLRKTIQTHQSCITDEIPVVLNIKRANDRLKPVISLEEISKNIFEAMKTQGSNGVKEIEGIKKERDVLEIGKRVEDNSVIVPLTFEEGLVKEEANCEEQLVKTEDQMEENLNKTECILAKMTEILEEHSTSPVEKSQEILSQNAPLFEEIASPKVDNLLTISPNNLDTSESSLHFEAVKVSPNISEPTSQEISAKDESIFEESSTQNGAIFGQENLAQKDCSHIEIDSQNYSTLLENSVEDELIFEETSTQNGVIFESPAQRESLTDNQSQNESRLMENSALEDTLFQDSFVKEENDLVEILEEKEGIIEAENQPQYASNLQGNSLLEESIFQDSFIKKEYDFKKENSPRKETILEQENQPQNETISESNSVQNEPFFEERLTQNEATIDGQKLMQKECLSYEEKQPESGTNFEDISAVEEPALEDSFVQKEATADKKNQAEKEYLSSKERQPQKDSNSEQNSAVKEQFVEDSLAQKEATFRKNECTISEENQPQSHSVFEEISSLQEPISEDCLAQKECVPSAENQSQKDPIFEQNSPQKVHIFEDSLAQKEYLHLPKNHPKKETNIEQNSAVEEPLSEDCLAQKEVPLEREDLAQKEYLHLPENQTQMDSILEENASLQEQIFEDDLSQKEATFEDEDLAQKEYLHLRENQPQNHNFEKNSSHQEPIFEECLAKKEATFEVEQLAQKECESSAENKPQKHSILEEISSQQEPIFEDSLTQNEGTFEVEDLAQKECIHFKINQPKEEPISEECVPQNVAQKELIQLQPNVDGNLTKEDIFEEEIQERVPLFEDLTQKITDLSQEEEHLEGNSSVNDPLLLNVTQNEEDTLQNEVFEEPIFEPVNLCSELIEFPNQPSEDPLQVSEIKEASLINELVDPPSILFVASSSDFFIEEEVPTDVIEISIEDSETVSPLETVLEESLSNTEIIFGEKCTNNNVSSFDNNSSIPDPITAKIKESFSRIFNKTEEINKNKVKKINLQDYRRRKLSQNLEEKGIEKTEDSPKIEERVCEKQKEVMKHNLENCQVKLIRNVDSNRISVIKNNEKIVDRKEERRKKEDSERKPQEKFGKSSLNNVEKKHEKMPERSKSLDAYRSKDREEKISIEAHRSKETKEERVRRKSSTKDPKKVAILEKLSAEKTLFVNPSVLKRSHSKEDLEDKKKEAKVPRIEVLEMGLRKDAIKTDRIKERREYEAGKEEKKEGKSSRIEENTEVRKKDERNFVIKERREIRESYGKEEKSLRTEEHKEEGRKKSAIKASESRNKERKVLQRVKEVGKGEKKDAKIPRTEENIGGFKKERDETRRTSEYKPKERTRDETKEGKKEAKSRIETGSNNEIKKPVSGVKRRISEERKGSKRRNSESAEKEDRRKQEERIQPKIIRLADLYKPKKEEETKNSQSSPHQNENKLFKRKRKKRFRNLYTLSDSEEDSPPKRSKKGDSPPENGVRVKINLDSISPQSDLKLFKRIKSRTDPLKQIPKMIIKKSGSTYSTVLRDARVSMWQPKVVLERFPSKELENLLNNT